MTTDLFTRLAHRAIGGAAVTMQPAPEAEPEPVWDEDGVTELAAEVDAPPTPDAPPAADAARSPGSRPAGPVVTSPVPGPVMPTLPPLPGPPQDPVPGSRSPATPPSADPTAAAHPQAAEPPGADSDNRPADAGAGQLRPRAGTLEPPPMPVIEPPPRAPDRQPTTAATPRTSVEVTVGRIEIRVRPPAHRDAGTLRPAVSPAPALPLDEYLRRREASP